MTHARQYIRERISTVTLEPLAALTGPGEIYRARVYPKTLFPVISVYTTGRERHEVENPGYVNGGTKRYIHISPVIIEIGIKGNTDPADALDDLCVHVERHMANDDSLGGGVMATDLVETVITGEGEGEEQLHIARYTYEVHYRSDGNDPETFNK